MPLNKGLRPARRQGGAARASHIPRELALPCPLLLHSLRFSPSTRRPHPACGARHSGDAAHWDQGAACTAPHLLPLGPLGGSASPDVHAGLWADPQACVHQCSGTTQAAPRVGWGQKPQEAGASAERHAVPDGEQSLAPRPSHVASPGAGWAGGPPLCPGEQAVEAASVWADRPVGCMHALLPHALQCADGPASPVPHPDLSGALQGALVSTRQRRKLRLEMAGTRLRTLSRLTPKLHALGPTPVATPTRAWRRCGSRLSHRSPCALVRSPALKEEAVRGWGGSTELHGLWTKGSHRSVKSFCTSLRWEILSSCPGQPEPRARGSLLNTVNFHLGRGSPMQGGPGACYYGSSGSGLPELLAQKKSLPPNGPRPTPRTPCQTLGKSPGTLDALEER